MTPTFSFRPLIAAVAADGPSRLDLLLSIQPPPLPPDRLNRQRPPLNLALVIDRSGSMQGEKLARELLAHFGLEWGDTTPDGRLTVEATYCLGLCACAPSAMLDGQPMARLTPQSIDEISSEVGR